MKTSVSLVEWFRKDLPPTVIPDPAVIVGGTSLLSQMIVAATESGADGEIAIATPWIGKGIVNYLPGLRAMRHAGIDLLIVTRSRAEARKARDELGSLPWKSLKIQFHTTLHAKLYTFLNEHGGGVCLLGSHNLTRAGSAKNNEAGVMFIGMRDPNIAAVVQGCRDHIWRMATGAKTFWDTTHWPSHETINYNEGRFYE